MKINDSPGRGVPGALRSYRASGRTDGRTITARAFSTRLRLPEILEASAALRVLRARVGSRLGELSD